MGRFVLLRHEVPDGTTHLDLMLERDDTAAPHRLVTWRLPELTDLRTAAVVDAERLPDHRAVYLDYEGPLPAPPTPGHASAGRPATSQGSVVRVLHGDCSISELLPARVAATLSFDDITRRLTAVQSGNVWMIELHG